ncbi:TPA_asm: ABC transporter substrate-binding protein, partial [Listeria monocytogenes]|nr:ABC transporter substrate-binding protein [Listeria monocytogenes]
MANCPTEKNITTNTNAINPIGVTRSGVSYLIFNKNKANPVEPFIINYLKAAFNSLHFVSELYDN